MRQGHPVLFTCSKDIIQTKVLRTTGMEEAYDFFFFPPSLSQPARKSYWWQSSGWVSGWNDSWLERNKLCLKSPEAVLTLQESFQTALVWKDQFWYEKLCWGKGLRTIRNPPKAQPLAGYGARGSAQGLVHPSELFFRKFCVHTGQIRGFFCCLHSHLLTWVLISSCGCHFSQLWPLSCKKWRCKLCWDFFSPQVVFSVKGLCTCGNWIPGFCAWKIRALPFGEVHLVSPENLKTPFSRKGPCLLSWGRVKEQKREISFLLPWSI